MVITPQIKERVVGALLSDMEQRGFKSQADYAKFIVGQLDIAFDKAAFSQIKKPEGRNAIKDSSWLRLARHFNVLDNHRWNKADTATFKIVTGAITLCKKRGIWQVLCDNAGVGKTYAAKYFAETHKHSAVYIDCSQSLTKSEFILEAARQLGLERTSTYARLWREVTEVVAPWVPLEGEIRTQFGDADFLVYIPLGVDREMIEAEIERFKQALTRYKIIQN